MAVLEAPISWLLNSATTFAALELNRDAGGVAVSALSGAGASYSLLDPDMGCMHRYSMITCVFTELAMKQVS